MTKYRWLMAMLFAVALAPTALLAQEPAVVTGRVTSAGGSPEVAVSVRINALNVGTTTAADGTYRLVVPASRVRAGQALTITAGRVGLSSQSRTVTLSPGASLTQNFQLGTDVLQLEGIVATGQGTTTTRERVTTAISTVRTEEITQSREANITTALAAKAPGVNVTSSSGDPGSGTYIRIRDAASIVGGTQPLFVVDGTPISNASNATEGTTGGTAVANRAIDINPNDVERVEILKGASATAIYGSRGANGVVLITTKRGQAGRTRATLSSTFGYDEVNKLVPLQRTNSQGLDRGAFVAFAEHFGLDYFNAFWGFRYKTMDELRAANVGKELGFPGSWGLPVGDAPTYDHAGELFRDAQRFENNLTLQGGTERTTYLLSVGRLDQNGIVRGNSEYTRNTARLKASHFFSDALNVTGNFAFTQSDTDLIQQGSNISGLLLGGLRTPPEFNNLPYRDPVTGLHRSYRCNETTGCVGGAANFFNPNRGRGYDNPFFIANENLNESQVGRAFGNVAVDYTPLAWLRVNYTLGADYANDERLTYFPNSSSGAPTGRVISGNFVNQVLDSNLSATASGSLSEMIEGSLTIGQNLNQTEFRRDLLTGNSLVEGVRQPNFAVTRVANDFESRQRTDGYFATGEMTLADQLTVNATGRLDGSSTFGGDGKRFFYPSVGAAWQFSRLGMFDNMDALSFGKLRASWGRTGRQPPVYATTSGFSTGTFTDGYVSPGGLESIYGGQGGVFSQATLGNPDIRPEEKTEYEVGADLAFFDQRVSMGVTYFNNRTEDVILSAPLPSTTGYLSQVRNAAEFTGRGWEASLDVVPVQRENFSWTVGGQYSRSRTCVENLAGSEDIFLNGFTGSTVSLVGKGVAGSEGCNQFGVLFGDDFVRFGRGLQVDGQDIDAAFPNAQKGALYIGEDGFPLLDDQSRVVGDPNPDWTASIRNTFEIGKNLRLSGLVDIRQGGDVWNGTKGALYYFGTHAETKQFQGAGTRQTFGQFALPNGETPAVGGPGAGVEVPLNWSTWIIGGIGSGFTGPFSQFVEDGSFVKLRDISLGYTFTQPFVERIGMSSIDLTVSGRNLRTWTDYTGIDPESNLTAQSTGRGLDYFNNPQSRSWVLSVNLNR